MGARFEPQAGQIERQSQCPEHQVGAQRGVGDDVDAGAEGPDQDAEDDRAACESQFHGNRNPGDRHGNASQREAEDQADEHRREVGFVEALDGVAEDFLDVADRLRFAHHGQTVAQLQTQVGGGQQLHARAVHAADVDAVGVPQAQLREFLAVDFGACHEDALRDELAVDGVPVDIFRVPVLGLLLAEDQPQGVGLAGRGDDQDQVVLL